MMWVLRVWCVLSLLAALLVITLASVALAPAGAPLWFNAVSAVVVVGLVASAGFVTQRRSAQ